jgi:hypothetical protein
MKEASQVNSTHLHHTLMAADVLLDGRLHHGQRFSHAAHNS